MAAPYTTYGFLCHTCTKLVLVGKVRPEHPRCPSCWAGGLRVTKVTNVEINFLGPAATNEQETQR